MTRTGKIARLSQVTREQLNRRIQDGQSGKRLVAWLNGLPEVLVILKAEFGGRPISEQNLSEWKAGGFQDWLHHQEALAFARTLVEEAGDLEQQSTDGSLADRLSAPVALALGRLCREILADDTIPAKEKLARILPLAAELAQVRRNDHEQELLELKRERWAHELETERNDRASAEKLSPLYGLLMGQALRGIYREEADGKRPVPPELRAFLASAAGMAGANSEPVRPDQTKSN